MKYVIAFVLLFNLTGCAGLLAPVGDFFDKQDACQTKSRPPGTPPPSYCGASAGKSITVTQGLSRNNYLVNVK